MDLAHLNDRGIVLVGCGRMGGALLRGWLAHGRRLLWFNRVMALALVATAAWMLWSAST